MKKILLCALAAAAAGLPATAQTGWTDIGQISSSVFNVYALVATDNGSIYAGAHGGVNFMRLEEGSWLDLGALLQPGGLNGAVIAMKAVGNKVHLAGTFTNPAQSVADPATAVYDGSSLVYQAPLQTVYFSHAWAIAANPQGNVFVGGMMKNGNNNAFVGKWTGTGWSELGGINSLPSAVTPAPWIQAMALDAAGNVYAAGSFQDGSGNFFVAKYDGAGWSKLGNGNFNSQIDALVFDEAGNLYAGGHFRDASGKCYVAKFNGTAWSSLGGNFDDIIYTLAARKGQVYAAGRFHNTASRQFVAHWNGSSWAELGGANSLNADGDIYALLAMPNGDIYASGDFRDSSLAHCRVSRFHPAVPAGIAAATGADWSLTATPNHSSTGRYRIQAHIAGVREVQLRVVDVAGRLLLSETLPLQNGRLDHPVSLADAAPGTYWLSLGNGGAQARIPLQKQ